MVSSGVLHVTALLTIFSTATTTLLDALACYSAKAVSSKETFGYSMTTTTAYSFQKWAMRMRYVKLNL